MKITNTAIHRLLEVTAASVCLISLTGQTAMAGQLYNGWNYGIDAFDDGSGGASFEIKGMAIKETEDNIFVALTGGMPLAGVSNSGAADGNIGWGDLFFNFSGTDFQTASNTSSLLGIHFSATDDSGAASTGVYKNVRAASVAGVNHGYNSLNHYYTSGWERTNTQGTDLATKQAAYNYFGQYNSIQNVISSGTKIGDITMLTSSDLTNAGLNFSNFQATGTQTIGFMFDRSLFGSGAYTSNIFLECGNDGVSLTGNLTEVPEPSGIVGLALLGLTAAGSLRRKSRSLNVM